MNDLYLSDVAYMLFIFSLYIAIPIVTIVTIAILIKKAAKKKA